MPKPALASRLVLVVLAISSVTTPQLSVAQQHSTCALPDPVTEPVASSAVQENFGPINLYWCRTKLQPRVIECSFYATKARPGSQTFSAADPEWRALVKLHDNFNEEHQLVGAYYVNGHCHTSSTVNLGQGDATWINLDFSNPADDVTKARINWPNYNVNGYRLSQDLEFRAPVVRGQ